MFKAVKLFEDPTKGLINLRLIQHIFKLTEFTDLNGKEKEELFNLLILIGRKLASVWQHLEEYKKYEEALIVKAKENPIVSGRGVVQVEPSQELFNEFDEFLVQIKSCLDYMVKVPAIIVGPKRWTIRTFANKGEDVINGLQRNLPKEYSNSATAVIHFIEKNQNWLEDTISARDKINHFIDGGINFEYFSVICIKEGEKVTLQLPMWSNEQTIRDFMQIIWNNLFRLCENFIVSTLHMRFKKEYALYSGKVDIGSVESPWKVASHEEFKRVTSNSGWKSVD